MNISHGTVRYKPGEFSAWPANGGMWCWGDEILVSFNTGRYRENDHTHCIDQDDKICASFSRSMDGGHSWTDEEPQSEIYEQPVKPVPPGGFDLSNPDFIIRVALPRVLILSGIYIVSHDRGRTWDGPYCLPDFGFPLTGRTCYFIEGGKTMRLFLSHRLPNHHSTEYTDRCIVVETTDGCQSFSMTGEVTEDLPRSVMPSAVRLDDGTIVTAMRRRLQKSNYPADMIADTVSAQKPWDDDNWIEVRRSADDGRTWTNPVRAAETSCEYGNNGNPPALAKLHDGRLVLAYGWRGAEPSMKIRISGDGGLTWGEEIVLRNDARCTDLGYPRMVVRADGACVIAYYIATNEQFEQHIASTVVKLQAEQES